MQHQAWLKMYTVQIHLLGLIAVNKNMQHDTKVREASAAVQTFFTANQAQIMLTPSYGLRKVLVLMCTSTITATLLTVLNR